MTPAVMLESDLGEGWGVWSFGDDDRLLSIVDGANVACGFHGGDPAIMARTCAAAATAGVRIGAHVAYRDLAGFGRRELQVAPDELVADIVFQIGALRAVAAAAGARVEYLKAHGALYNRAGVDAVTAGAIARAVQGAGDPVPVVCQPGTVMAAVALQAGLPVEFEGFADRAILPTGLLAARSMPGSLITDPRRAAERAVRMVVEGRVAAVDGSDVAFGAPITAVCVHSDTPGAASVAEAVDAALREAGVPRRRAG